MTRLLFTFAAVLLVHAPLAAQVSLTPKPQEGRSYVSELTLNLNQTLALGGADNATQMETVVRTRHTVGPRDAAGKVQEQEQTEALRVSMTAYGMTYTFDSANPDAKSDSALDPLLRGVHKVIANLKATKTYGRDNRVQTVSIDENVLGALPVQTQDLLRSEINPQRQKDEANQQLAMFPDEPVSPGDHWKRTETSHFGAGQVMTFEMNYTYDGTVEEGGKRLHKITGEPKSVKFAIENSPLPLTLKSADLTPKGKTTTLFDAERGQTVRTDSELTITGPLTFTIQDMELPSQLDLTIRSALTIKDAEPGGQ